MSPMRKPWTYLLVDLTHGEVLVVAGARHTDVLEPAAGPRQTGIHAELLTAQVFGDLPRKENQGQRQPVCLRLHTPDQLKQGPAAQAREGRRFGTWTSLTLRQPCCPCPGALGAP